MPLRGGRRVPQLPESTVAAARENLYPPIGRAADFRLTDCANPKRPVGAEVLPRRPVAVGRRLLQVPNMIVAAAHENLYPPIGRPANSTVRHHQKLLQLSAAPEGLHEDGTAIGEIGRRSMLRDAQDDCDPRLTIDRVEQGFPVALTVHPPGDGHPGRCTSLEFDAPLVPSVITVLVCGGCGFPRAV